MKLNFDSLINNETPKKSLVHAKPLSIEGLTLYKYSRSCFYDNQWHKDSRLLEARGIITDAEDNVIVLPFKKVFNINENGTRIDRDRQVVAIKKMNGFMGVATEYNGSVIYSTTGTIDSDFALMAKNDIESVMTKDKSFVMGYTFLFEIVNEQDKHIISETPGVYLIGMRDLDTGELVQESTLDSIAETLNFKRPEWRVMRYSDVAQEAKTALHEGFMIRAIDDDGKHGEHLAKLKSPYYLSKKFVMRCNPNLIFDDKYTNRMDEEYFPVVESIKMNFTKECWSEVTEQDKGKIVDYTISRLAGIRVPAPSGYGVLDGIGGVYETV